jgi:hypothetical protein
VDRSTLLAAFGEHIESLPLEDRAPQWLSGHLIEFIMRALKDALDALGGVEEVVKFAEEAYTKYVTPIDLPGIPNFIEPAVDKAAIAVISAVIRAAYAQAEDPVGLPPTDLE